MVPSQFNAVAEGACGIMVKGNGNHHRNSEEMHLCLL